MESKELQQHVKAFMQAHLDHPTTAQVCDAFIESLGRFQHYSQQQQEFITAVRAAFQERNIPHAKTALDDSSFIICVGDIPIFLDDIKTLSSAIEVFNEVIQQYPDMKEPVYFANPCVTSIYVTIKNDKPEKVSNVIRQLASVGVSHFRLISSSETDITVQMTTRIKSSDFDEEGYYATTAMFIKLISDETKTRMKIKKAHRPYHLLDAPEDSHTEIQRLYGNYFEYAGHGKIIHLPTYPDQTTRASYIGIAFDEKEGQHLVTILDREMPIIAQNYCTVTAESAEQLNKFTKQFRKKLKEMKLPLDICRHQCVLDSEQVSELQSYIKSLKHQESYTIDPHRPTGCTCNCNQDSSDSD